MLDRRRCRDAAPACAGVSHGLSRGIRAIAAPHPARDAATGGRPVGQPSRRRPRARRTRIAAAAAAAGGLGRRSTVLTQGRDDSATFAFGALAGATTLIPVSSPKPGIQQPSGVGRVAFGPDPSNLVEYLGLAQRRS